MRTIIALTFLILTSCKLVPSSSDSSGLQVTDTTPAARELLPVPSATKPIDPFDFESLNGTYTVSGASNYALVISNQKATLTWIGYGPSLNNVAGINNLYYSVNTGTMTLERTQDDRNTYGTISLIGTVESVNMGTGNYNSSGRMSGGTGSAEYLNIYSYTSDCLTVGGVLNLDSSIVWVSTYNTYTALLNQQSNRITFCRGQ